MNLFDNSDKIPKMPPFLPTYIFVESTMTDVIVCAKSFSHEIFWGFSVSRTGQLDFDGKITAPKAADLAKMQHIEPSGYFSPSWYTYLPELMQSKITVYAKNGAKLEDPDLFSYITHIGALLLAVEAKDTLLAAELFDRRSYVFMKFYPITAYILEDIAPEMLFAWQFGRFSDDSENPAKVYKTASPENSTCAQLFKIAEKKLRGEKAKENLDEMFVRYFKAQKKAVFTIGIVGANYRHWDSGIDYLDDILEKHIGEDLLNGTTKVRDTKQRIYDGIRANVQAEPYNQYDPNAIAVSLEDIESIVTGNPCMKKAGYIRATGAAILRKAFAEKISFPATLARIGNLQDGNQGIVVRIKF